MGYIWQDYRQDKEYRIGGTISPYFEVFDTDADIVSFNPMLRFTELFYGYINTEDGECYTLDDFTDYIDPADLKNVVAHILAQIDRQFGLTPLQVVMNKVTADIKCGNFGVFIRDNWDIWTAEEQNIIAHNLALRLLDYQNVDYFVDTLRKLYKIVELQYEEPTDIYYLYIDDRKNEQNEIKLEFVKKLFWNFTDKLRVFWFYHYGIIGIDETMRIDEIEIV